MIQLPHDEKLEAIVLGTLMSFPNSINEVGNMIKEDWLVGSKVSSDVYLQFLNY